MAGKKGKRFILPNAKVMIHQPFGGVYGQAADIEIQAEEILKTKETLITIMAKCTGQTWTGFATTASAIGSSMRHSRWNTAFATRCSAKIRQRRRLPATRPSRSERRRFRMLYLGVDHPAIACHDVKGRWSGIAGTWA